MNRIQGLTAGLLALALVNCGGSSGNSQLQTGVFIDGPAAGVEYTTPSQSGITDQYGQFSYLPGELVTFTVGPITLGTAPAASEVFIFDLDGIGDPFDEVTRNKVRVLLALDEDQVGGNGITISSEFLGVVKGWPEMDFANDDFSTQGRSALAQELAENSGNTAYWPTATETLNHVTDTLACANAGIYATEHPEHNGETLYFIVHPSGLMQLLDTGAMQSAWTNLQFHTKGGAFDYSARPLVAYETDHSLAGPYEQSSGDDYPYSGEPFNYSNFGLPVYHSDPSFDETVIYLPLLYSNHSLINLSSGSGTIIAEAPTNIEFSGSIDPDHKEMAVVWQAEQGLVAKREMVAKAGEHRILVSFIPMDPFMPDPWQQGLVEILLNSDGSASGKVIDAESMLVSDLMVDVELVDDQVTLYLTGDAGFEMTILANMSTYEASVISRYAVVGVGASALSFIVPSSIDGNQALVADHSHLVQVCR